MSKLSLNVITAIYLELRRESSVLVSCFQQATQSSDAVIAGFVRDVESEI